jgi:hypothetical protein
LAVLAALGLRQSGFARRRRARSRGEKSLAPTAQISALGKLKLVNCARRYASHRFFGPAGDHNRGYLLFAEIHCCLQ